MLNNFQTNYSNLNTMYESQTAYIPNVDRWNNSISMQD